MTANSAATQEPSQQSLLFRPTLLEDRLELATCKNYNSTATELWSLSFGELIEQFKIENVAIAPHKEGKGFVVGPCTPVRNNANLPYATVAAIDADMSIVDGDTTESGAPHPNEVHDLLTRLNLSHTLYTTFSHGTGKGNRYRILIPCQCKNKYELAGIVTYYVSMIQEHGVPLAFPPESLVWSQLWQLPKRSGPQAPYWSATHLGVVPDPRQLAILSGLVGEDGAPISVLPPQVRTTEEKNKGGVIGFFNRYHRVEDLLEANGYTFESNGTSVNDAGEAQITRRYRRPGSTSGAGVVVFVGSDGHSRAYSHHATDLLANGRANDAFEVFKLLSGFEHGVAMKEAIPLIQAAVSAEMNRQYPAVMEGSQKFKIGNRFTDEFGAENYTYMEWGSFVMKMSNLHPVPVLGTTADGQEVVKFTAVPDFWKFAKERIMHNGLVYLPCGILQERQESVHLNDNDDYDYFNTFPGWGVEPCKGEWPLLEWHLRYAITGGVEREYDYFLNWMAHLVQYPGEKPGVALAIRGRKGWGKSLLFKLLAKALGVNAIVVGDNVQLTGRFNSHLRQKLLIVAEESFFSGSRRDESVLKHLVTDDSTTYEKKGLEAVQGKSYCRVVMITNEDWAVPASADERRYFLPSLTDASYQQDLDADGHKGQFFPQLIREMENGGLEAFMWDMAHRHVTHDMIANVPETKGLSEQRALSLRGIESWLFTSLCNGEIRQGEEFSPWNSAGCYIQESKMKESLIGHLSKYEHERNVEFRLNTILFEAFGHLVSREVGYRRFGSLHDCRLAFIRYTRLNRDVFELHGVPVQEQPAGSNVVAMKR